MIHKIYNRVKNEIKFKLYEDYVNRFPQLKRTTFHRLTSYWLSHNIELVDYDEVENLVLLKKDNLLFMSTPDYPWIIIEIFGEHIYFINPKYLKNKEYIVVDMGMNRGYASLYFANQAWCKEVHGYELNEATFELAKKNVDLNCGINNKIRIYNFGLGEKNETVTMYYLPDRDGICTTSKEFLTQYAPEEIKNIRETKSIIKKSSTVLREIIGNNITENVILKIDVEGAEYEIIDDIAKNFPEVFKSIDVIIGEAHLGLKRLIDILSSFGFKEVSRKKPDPKLIDFLFVKN